MWDKIKDILIESFDLVVEKTECSNCKFCHDNAVELFSNVDFEELANDIIAEIQNELRKKKPKFDDIEVDEETYDEYVAEARLEE